MNIGTAAAALSGAVVAYALVRRAIDKRAQRKVREAEIGEAIEMANLGNDTEWRLPDVDWQISRSADFEAREDEEWEHLRTCDNAEVEDNG